jgi:pyridoxamine 5'-phosphate oxidase
MVPDQSLPETLPAEPMPIVAEWLAEAMRRRDQPNPNAMVLATCDEQGRPAARVVLAKEIDAAQGTVRFVTNYESRKGQELQRNPRAALVMHWDHLHRQVRIEGVVRRAAAAESDAYFASRARASQLGAHASAQSQPIASRAAMEARLAAVEARYPASATVPRPAHWGGYVLWADAVELWMEGAARVHDRAQWRRTLALEGDAVHPAGAWTATRLQP